MFVSRCTCRRISFEIEENQVTHADFCPLSPRNAKLLDFPDRGWNNASAPVHFRDDDPYQPPEKSLDIGNGHRICIAEYQGEWAGVNDYHLKADGSWCAGWAPFAGFAWARQFAGQASFQAWQVVQREPLTLSPSLLCRACGDHGFIQNGRWVKA